MCKDCMTEAGAPVPFTDAMLDAAEKVDAVYEVDGWGMGGPLHIYVDDFNLEDRWFDAVNREFVIECHRKAGDPAETLPIALAAFDALAGLTWAERATVCDA